MVDKTSRGALHGQVKVKKGVYYRSILTIQTVILGDSAKIYFKDIASHLMSHMTFEEGTCFPMELNTLSSMASNSACP